MGPNLPKLCNGRLGLVNPIIINLLFIAAGNAQAPVVWERLLLDDGVIEHRFVSGEKPREREIDGRCQSELHSSVVYGARPEIEMIE
jgi:hypothetical protein